MKLLGIKLENVRRFVEPTEITGIGDGVNVLSAPNERGKSTIFDALHALFFKDRKSWDKDIRGLVPHVGGDPTVSVDFDLDADTFRIEKTWKKSRNGDIRVWRNGQLFKQADEAETWLSGILKAPRDGGPAGLLWVRQGLTSLDEDGEAGRSARRDLMSSVAGEVEAMTGGRRMDQALATCSEELAAYLTTTGKPKADGPLKRLQNEVAELEARREELAGTAARLKQELERRRKVRKELEELEAPEEKEARTLRLAEARKALEEAESHTDKLRAADLAVERAQSDVDQATERLQTIGKIASELEAAARQLSEAQAAAETSGERFKVTSQESETAERKYSHARAAWHTASETLQLVSRAETQANAAQRQADLAETLRKAEDHRSQMEAATAEAHQGLSAADLQSLETLERDLRAARRAREANAAWIKVDYAAGQDGGIKTAGKYLPGEERIPVTEPLELDVGNIGTLTVNPGTGASASTAEEAEAAFKSALTSLGCDDIEEARRSARKRSEAEARALQAKSALDALAPKGIGALRNALAALPVPEDSPEDLPDRATAEEAETAAKAAFDEAEVAREAARTAVAEAQRLATGAASTLEAADSRHARATEAAEGLGDLEEEGKARLSRLDAARLLLSETSATREALAKDAPDLEAARATCIRVESAIQRAEEDSQRLRVELGQLDVSISMRSGEAVEEELADTETKLGEARARLTALEFEILVLKRLKAALENARSAARDRYMEPVKTELVPLLRLLWEDSELQFDAEDVLPTSLVRNGQEEDFSVLSGGTKEQIALLVRLAFARMLAKAGTPAPVILDDAIVYTDDDRIERMFDALTRQAQDLQIIVFSCRQKAFRDLGGRSLAITTASSGTEATP
ncbi:hypothetical protein KBY23_01920 [Ruegeria pomeroyi]|nr:hypothetical protein [Ruegeria pomeroyi]